MTVYGIGEIISPYYFLNLYKNFMKKLAHVGSEYSRNILNFIFLFLDDNVKFTKFIIILDAPRCISIYQIILLTIF